MLDIPLTESSDYHASAHLTVAKLAALTLDLANFQIPFDKFFFPLQKTVLREKIIRHNILMSWSRIISISFSLMCLLEKLQNVRGNKADFWNHCTCSQNHSIAIVFNSCMTVIYRLLLWKLRSKMRLVELQLATFSLPQFHKCFFLYYRDKRSWTSEVLCATLHFFLITDLCFLQTLTQQRPKYSPLRTRKWLQSTLWCNPLRQYKESTAEWSWPIMDSNVCFIIFAMPWVFYKWIHYFFQAKQLKHVHCSQYCLMKHLNNFFLTMTNPSVTPNTTKVRRKRSWQEKFPRQSFELWLDQLAITSKRNYYR